MSPEPPDLSRALAGGRRGFRGTTAASPVPFVNGAFGSVGVVTGGSATAPANALTEHDERPLEKRDAATSRPMPDGAGIPVDNATTTGVAAET